MTGPHGGLSVPCPGNRREQWARPGGGEVTRGVATGRERRERDCLPGHCLPSPAGRRRGGVCSRPAPVRKDSAPGTDNPRPTPGHPHQAETAG